tara:strand:+ start:713 stop:1174 length:462 start_codon:yes stop_codon:yes gene_type:complete
VKNLEKIMSGKILVISLVGFSFAFGFFVYYFQVFSYYSKVEGLDYIFVDGKKINVEQYYGLDSSISGLKLRGCFKVNIEDFKTFKKYKKATPLQAPFWFNCFDNEKIQKSLENNDASAFLAEENELDGIDRIVAIYSDGRGYQWRQLNSKYME